MSRKSQPSKTAKAIWGSVTLLFTLFRVNSRLGWSAWLIALGASMAWYSPFSWMWIAAACGLAVHAIVMVARGLDDSGLSTAWPRVSTLVLTLTPIAVVSVTAAGV